MVEAIPVTYRGIRFRSRLEADWAATLDHLNVAWYYEPEGFKLSNGQWYSPDFYLPASKAWLEVKGSHQERLDKVEQFAADLWDEFWAADSDNWARCLDGENPSPYHAAHLVDVCPLVIIGSEPVPNGLINKIGVMGPGRKYTVVIDRCVDCRQVVFATIGTDRCRNCGSSHFSHTCELCHAEQQRLPRPFEPGWKREL